MEGIYIAVWIIAILLIDRARLSGHVDELYEKLLVSYSEINELTKHSLNAIKNEKSKDN